MKLFEPTSIEMKTEYPELDNIQEFASLSDKELRFIWYYANVTSEFFGIKDKAEKANKCLQAVYGLNCPLSKNEIIRYEKGQFPEDFKPAIDRMKKFSASDRTRGKAMVESIFDNFESIINGSQDMVYDPDRQGKYIDNALKIVEALPDLIKKKEEGFGHKLQSKKKDERAPSLMDEVMLSGDDLEYEEEND